MYIVLNAIVRVPIICVSARLVDNVVEHALQLVVQ